jgi:DNA-binding MarR family transcriptional regulator
MQSLQDATISPQTHGGHGAAPAECARAMLDGMPPVMWFIRRHLRRHRTRGVSVPQYRVLCVLDAHPQSSLSAVADNLGLGLPATSRLVTGLVGKGLVARKSRPGDRRQVSLVLTPKGRAAMNMNRQLTIDELAGEIAHLSEAQRETIVEAMSVLRGVFGIAAPAASPHGHSSAPASAVVVAGE